MSMIKKKTTVVIAPYSPPSTVGLSNLAASKKIQSILKTLSFISERVILINSAHNIEKLSKSSCRLVNIEGRKIIELRPWSLPIRAVGKLSNLLFPYTNIIKKLRRKYIIQIIWIYNGYAFESIFLDRLQTAKTMNVLEMEDMPYSRNRGGYNIKDKFDAYLLKRVLKKINVLTAVNNAIFEQLNVNEKCKKILLPVLVPAEKFQFILKEPFHNEKIKIGYFGGLEKDKGIETLIHLSTCLSDRYELHITGSGTYEAALKAASKNCTSLKFYGVVELKRLYEIMNEMDILINPHESIEHMQNGIFPFKVCEYLCMQKLIISTSLPFINEHVQRALIIYNESERYLDLLEKINSAETLYYQKINEIRSARNYILSNFTEDALSKTIFESKKEFHHGAFL